MNVWLLITAVLFLHDRGKKWRVGIFTVNNYKILYYSFTVEKLDRCVSLIPNI